MSIKTYIIDPRSSKKASVSGGGYLAVGPFHPSESFNAELGEPDVPVNILPAKTNTIFTITGIVLTGNKQVDNVVDATVTIYEATGATSAVQSKVLLEVPVARSGNLTMTALHLDASESVYINGVTDDDDIFVTILGYYWSTL